MHGLDNIAVLTLSQATSGADLERGAKHNSGFLRPPEAIEYFVL